MGKTTIEAFMFKDITFFAVIYVISRFKDEERNNLFKNKFWATKYEWHE